CARVTVGGHVSYGLDSW
nr:immunoglobulin heavy chain junction region [Macaca mulatta]MOV49099.1 immunoglobulin heavy chain junction region [Macaca mulatta]MOV49101.1 immunoglobulin heavy chain junction region [Macaca mulatta]MOV49124.1 immunoglobulin heavy chain junction region [Macaca mulatta]MOV49173.1 immunoglobulin heavy chain junction region [Macaca mulatta]